MNMSSSMSQSIILMIVGLIAGICSGIFGIGGGIIIVPMLMFFLKYPQSMATGTSLIALLLPVGILGVFKYFQEGKITTANIKAGLFLSLGLFLGAYLGASIATQLPQKLLQKGFAILLLGVAVKLWF